jgi:hypothetical protein
MKSIYFMPAFLILGCNVQASAASSPIATVLNFRADDQANHYSVAQRVAAAYGISVPNVNGRELVMISKANGVSEVRWTITKCGQGTRVLSWEVDLARGHLEPKDRASAVLSGLRYGNDPAY